MRVLPNFQIPSGSINRNFYPSCFLYLFTAVDNLDDTCTTGHNEELRNPGGIRVIIKGFESQEFSGGA